MLFSVSFLSDRNNPTTAIRAADPLKIGRVA
jgi:hypothetical protein